MAEHEPTQAAEKEARVLAITNVLTKHRYMARNAGGRTGCRGCRWVAKGYGEQARREHERHVAELVADALIPPVQPTPGDSA